MRSSDHDGLFISGWTADHSVFWQRKPQADTGAKSPADICSPENY